MFCFFVHALLCLFAVFLYVDVVLCVCVGFVLVLLYFREIVHVAFYVVLRCVDLYSVCVLVVLFL